MPPVPLPNLTGGAGGASGALTAPFTLANNQQINLGSTNDMFWLVMAFAIGGIIWLRRK